MILSVAHGLLKFSESHQTDKEHFKICLNITIAPYCGSIYFLICILQLLYFDLFHGNK